MLEASERAGRPIHKETIIFDCTHMGLWRKYTFFDLDTIFSWCAPDKLTWPHDLFLEFHMSGLFKLKQVADYVQSYYPETLNRLFVVNVPSAFLVMWKIVKPWLNLKVKEDCMIISKLRHWLTVLLVLYLDIGQDTNTGKGLPRRIAKVHWPWFTTLLPGRRMHLLTYAWRVCTVCQWRSNPIPCKNRREWKDTISI